MAAASYRFICRWIHLKRGFRALALKFINKIFGVTWFCSWFLIFFFFLCTRHKMYFHSLFMHQPWKILVTSSSVYKRTSSPSIDSAYFAFDFSQILEWMADWMRQWRKCRWKMTVKRNKLFGNFCDADDDVKLVNAKHIEQTLVRNSMILKWVCLSNTNIIHSS